MTEGTVRWFSVDGGGFIALGPDAEDLYVHASEIVSDNATKLLRAGPVPAVRPRRDLRHHDRDRYAGPRRRRRPLEMACTLLAEFA